MKSDPLLAIANNLRIQDELEEKKKQALKEQKKKEE